MTDTLIYPLAFKPPAASLFSTLVGTNSETPTLTDDANAGLLMDFGSNPAAGINVRGAYKPKGGTGSWDITIRHLPNLYGWDSNGAGLALRESSSGKILSLMPMHDGNLYFTRWTNPTTFSAHSQTFAMATRGISYEWLRISVVANDPKDVYASRNGKQWAKLASVSQTGFFTFDQVGFAQYYAANSGVQPIGNRISNAIMYFKDADTDPGF